MIRYLWLVAAAVAVQACPAVPSPTVAPSRPPASSVTQPTGTPAPAAPPTDGPTEPPTGSTEIVLRMSRTGGFVYPGTTLDQPPIFTLYSDGRVIYTVEQPLATGASRQVLRQARLTQAQVDTLVAYALETGALARAREVYADAPIADAPTTVFQIDAGDHSKTVSVYALYEFEGGVPDAEDRTALLTLANALSAFEADVAAGEAVDLGAFEASAYRVSLFPDTAGELTPTAEWPWDELHPDDFEVDDSAFGSLVVSPAEGAVVAELPVGEQGDPAVRGPDGVTYLVRARPLLPDELP